jgi:hypothetical protein
MLFLRGFGAKCHAERMQTIVERHFPETKTWLVVVKIEPRFNSKVYWELQAKKQTGKTSAGELRAFIHGFLLGEKAGKRK